MVSNCVFMGFLCVRMCLSASMCYLCFFFGFFSVFVCFALPYYGLCVFSNERKKCMDLCRKVGTIWEEIQKRNFNQNILYGKKIFSVKKQKQQKLKNLNDLSCR